MKKILATREARSHETAPSKRMNVRNTMAAIMISVPTITSQVVADEYVIGLGQDDVLNATDTQSVAFVIEYHANPFFSGDISDYSLAVAGQVDGDSDVWLGIGVYALWSVRDSNWFFDGSFMPGYYGRGSDGTPLGGNIQFRSLVGVGYKISNTQRVSLAIDHKSNAGLEDKNPGSETLVLRYTKRF